MAISTYSELKDAVEDWLDRDDLVNRIPDFITLAEAYINRDTKLRDQEKLATTDYLSSATSRFIALPSRFLRMYDIQIKDKGASDSTYRLLNYISPEYMWRKVRANVSGRPYWYTVRGSLEFDVLPNSNYTLRMHYLKGWDIENDLTNALLTNHPDVYLYGALMHAHLFIFGEASHPSVKQYNDLFEDAISKADLLHHRTRDDAELSTMEVAAISNYETVYEYDVINDR